MKIYLVGGAVRDKLLNYPVVEKDWVVVGATPQRLLQQGYIQVGKDFPVFLHPETKDEYALTRTERKSGQGYYGFDIDANPDVSLEQDLIRRDLTINAMAMDENGEIIDPYNGQEDIENKILRHVSPAFSEDPLRVIRVARFAARYHHLGFSIAPETLQLMRKIAESGELNSLAGERIWKETVRALAEKSPQVYFETLKSCDGLTYWFAELDKLWGIPNPPQWHPEIDSGLHTMMVLEQAAKLSKEPITRFAALCHDLGKGLTPKQEWPSHRGHEKAGVPLVEKLCKRIKAPADFCQLAKLTSEFHLQIHQLDELKPSTIVKLLTRTNAFRNPQQFQQLLHACEADSRGRTGFENRDYPQAEQLKQALHACQQVDNKELIKQGYQGKKLGDAIHQARVNAVKALKSTS
jgi:tRNA nucleotidyltransferase (CCA-adding enzyme)